MRDELRRLHAEAGRPSKAALQRYANLAGHHVGAATLIAVVSPTARNEPRRATVAAFVEACLAYAAKHGHHLADDDRDLAAWLDRYDRSYPPAPADDRFAAAREAYRHRLRERFGRIDTETLLPLSDQDEHSPVLLRDVFVPQHVRADPPPLELPRELLRRLRESGEITPGELPTGLDPARLRRLRQDYLDRPARPVLAALGRRTVILGDPGAGKSTLARYLALTATDVLPLLVELRAVVPGEWRSESFLDLIERQCAYDGLPREVLAKHLRDGGPALVVFDGLDEVFDPGTRQRVADQITGFAARHPQARVLVTSRVIGYRRAPFDAAGFTHHMLQDLDDAQVGDFARRWYHTACPQDPAHADRLGTRLLEAIAVSRAVRELAGNPLLLTILAIVARRTELPRDRRTAYEHAVTVLVEHWEVNKSLAATGAELPRLDREDKLELLRLVARAMQSGIGGIAGNHITGAELLAEFRSYLADTFGLAPGPARVAARAMIEQFHERNFILSRFGGDVYGFVHRAFLEYLAAADIVRLFDDRELTEDQLIGIVEAHWADPSWHEVLLLVTGMKERYAGRIVDVLLAVDPQWFRRDAVAGQILLAFRCLGEVRRIGALAPRVDALTEALLRMLERYSRRGVDPVLDRIEEAALPVLTALGPRWPGRQRYLDWYRARQPFLYSDYVIPLVHRDSAWTAARLGVAVLADHPEFRDLLLRQAATHQFAAGRIAAVHALAAGWPTDPATAAALCAIATTDPVGEVRRGAVDVVAGLPSDRSRIERLLRERAAHDVDPRVRGTAVEAFARACAEAADAFAFVRDRAAREDSPRACAGALRALATTWGHDPRTVAVLLDSGAPDRDPVVWTMAIYQLSRLRPGDPALRDLLLAGVRSGATEDNAADALDHLAAGWRDHPDTLPLVLEHITDARWQVRRAAVAALATGWRGHPRTRRIVRRAADDPHDEVRHTSVRALAENWPGADETPALLREVATRDPAWEVSEEAVELLATRWADAPDTLPWLLGAAAPGNPADLRRQALHRLVLRWGDRAEVRAMVDRCLAEADHLVVRREALRSLGRLRPDQPGAVLRHGADAEPAIRLTAVEEAAARWPERPETREFLLVRAAGDDEAAVRSEALQALAAAWPDHPATDDRLRRSLDEDDSPHVREIALSALAARRPDRSALRRFLLDRQHRAGEWEREEAAKLLATAWPGDEEIRTLLHRLAEDPAEYLRRAALNALVIGWRDRPETAALLRERQAGDPADSVRRTAMELLVTCRGDDPATAAAVRRSAAGDRAPAMRDRAAYLLAFCRPGGVAS